MADAKRESKYDDDTDTDYSDIGDDDYRYDEENEVASHQKREKQNADQNASATNLITVKRSKEVDLIQKCIGQIALLYTEAGKDEDETYRHGTGTAFMHLTSKYILILTCAHNLVYFDDKTASKKKVKKIYFFPNGHKNSDNRLVCVHWIAHPKYNPRMDHCQYDIGVVLCYDALKYFKKKLGVNTEKLIQIGQWTKKSLKHCCIYGYPVGNEGRLMGTSGKAMKDDKNEGRFYYEDICTYPGQSGSVLYREDEDTDNVYIIYGIHIFGDVDTQYNRAVRLDETSVAWIAAQENEMLDAMDTHRDAITKAKAMKKVKEKVSDLRNCLESMGLGEYYKNFSDRGCTKMMDLKDANSDELLNEFVITDYGHRKEILKGIQAHFGGDTQSETLEKLTNEKEKEQKQSREFDTANEAELEQKEKATEMDYFKHYSEGKWSTKDKGKTITKSKTGDKTVYASNVIKCNTNMVYKWSVKINKLGYGCIGIDESNHTHQNTYFCTQNDGSSHYAYHWSGHKYDSNGDDSEYLSKYGTGDTVNICVDTAKNTISFSKNKNRLNKAFDIQPTKNGYSLAVYAYYNGDSFSILKYDTFEPEQWRLRNLTPEQWTEEEKGVTEMDCFKYYTQGKWTVRDTDKTIIKSGTSRFKYYTAYASNVIKCNTDMVYKWVIKINELSTGKECCIGIDESNYSNQNRRFHLEKEANAYHYGYAAGNGNKYDTKGEKSEYLLKYGQGDTVNVFVDTEWNEIWFSKNNESNKKAFDIEPTKYGYSFAVTLSSKNDSVTIVSFTKWNKSGTK